MPIYEYQCESCRCTFERRQKFDEEPVAICGECGGKARRVLHSVPVIFKGGGFYITDSRKNPSETPAKTEAEKPAEKEKVKESTAANPPQKD